MPRHALERAIDSHSQELGEFFFAKLLGFTVDYEGDTCVVAFDACEYLHNPRGALHGGVLATALDIAMAHLVQRLSGAAATVELSVQYHRPVSLGRVRCVAEVTHRGSRVWFLRASARAECGKLLASATSTCMRVEPPSDASREG